VSARLSNRIREAVFGGVGSFRRSALLLTGGTLIAQVLPLLLYPVFTRIYTPVDFGVFATVSLFATVGAIVASGAYEQAILIATTRREAAHVAAYALYRSAILLAVLLILLVPVLVSAGFANLFQRIGVDPTVVPWLPSVPLGAAALVVYSCYSEWCVRRQYFAELAKVRIWQSSAIAVARLVLGLLVPTVNGFVAGEVVGKVVSAGRCAAMLARKDLPYLHIHSAARIRAVARRYAPVARYALPDQFINTLGGSIHVLFLGAAFGTEQLGYVSLVLSALYVPVTVVTSAVKDVFRQRASVEYASSNTCRPTYRRLLVPVSGVGLLGFGTLYLVAPTMFPLVLGPGWELAGEYARILTPLFFFNFVSISLGGVLVIAKRTDVSLIWQIVSLAMTVLALFIGGFVLRDIIATLWLFSLARSLSYILYMGLSYHYAERPHTVVAQT
jgi:O-antigen/teichoic acid export membrane protein